MLDTSLQLHRHHCVPCEGGTKPLTRQEFSVYLPQVKNWNIINNKSLERDFSFQNFREAIAFINKVAEVAESEGHHPDIYLHNYKKVKITLTTHSIKGLSINDFVMAVKIDELTKNFLLQR